MSLKETNPKDILGTSKTPFCCVPANVIAEIALGLFEGARKYGRHNYRVLGVSYSTYYSACIRHLTLFHEGQDIDPDSGLNHITKALSCLVVLRDAMLNDMWTDDRGPKVKNQNWMNECNDKIKELIKKYPEPVEPYTQKSLEDKNEKLIKEDKAKISYGQFLNSVYKSTPLLRRGQNIMGLLMNCWPEEYKRILGTNLDCFYNDVVTKHTLEHLKQVWRT